MQFGRLLLSSALVAATSVSCVAKTRHHHTGPLQKLHLRHSRPLGQRSIDDERATQIQTALIKSGYLTGHASGHWDDATETAMKKYQGDNGWQTKLTPDSRAIIKLGLGPAQDSAHATPATVPAAATTTPAANSTSPAIATTATDGADFLQ
jgi:peptidoglycan hydrolase-like protein with peptidoglycan-binding domain